MTRRIRRFAGGRRRLAAVGVAALVLIPAMGVLAYWTSAGSGTASATVLGLDAPTVAAENPAPGTAHIEWTAVASPDGNFDSEVEFTVERKPSTSETWIFVCGTGTTQKAYDELSCDDHPTVTDDYDYRVTAYFRSWTSQGMDTVHVETDAVPPQVASITRDDPTPTNASSVSWTVTFSEDVTGVDATDFALDGSGAAAASIASVSGDDDTYTVEVSVGGDGTLGLNVVDNDSIEDAASNPLAGPGAGNGDFTGQVYVIDRTGPSVSSITRAGSDPTNAASVSWTVTFSESVTGVDATDFALTASGVSGASVTSVTGGPSIYTVAAATGTGDGTLRLDALDDDSIEDGVGNALGGPFTGQAYTIDKTQPAVSSIDRSGPNPTNNGPLTWEVTFSEPVSNVGAANFSLTTANTGGTPPGIGSVTAVGGAPATTWNVNVSTTGTTAANNGSIRLDLSSIGSIQDPATNPLSATFNGQAYTYDTTQPTVSSIDRTGTNPTNNGPLTWQVVFSEPVSNVGAANFSLTTANTGGAAPSVDSVTAVGGAPATTWNVSVSTAGTTGANDGSIRLDLASIGSIQDPATNLLAATIQGQAYTYDTTPPAVSSINRSGSSPTNAASVSWTVTFSEGVSGVNAGDFQLGQGGSVSGAAITSVTGGGPYTVTADSGSGGGTLGLNLVDDDSIKDAATNQLGGTGAGNGNVIGEVFTIDKTPPTVISINRDGATPTNAASVAWTVMFSEGVEGVDVGDFAVAQAGGVAGASITGVTGTGPYTVTASTGAGNGTLGLNLADDDSIQDAATNRLGGAGAGNGSVTGQIYTIDKTAPTLTTLEMFDTNTNGKVDQVKATFSESLGTYTAGSVPWALANVPSSGSLATVSVAGASATLTITEGAGAANTGVGSFTVALSTNANGIRDAAGNESSFTATSPADKAAPIAIDIQAVNGSGTPGRIDSGDAITYTFSEPMAPGSIKTGWTGSATTITVTISQSGGTDTVAPASGSGVNLGVINTGGNYFQQPPGSQNVTASMAMSGATVVVTFTGTAPSGNLNTIATSTMTWTASATATDPAANPMVAAPRTQTGAPKQNF